jgi:hypothetical protein
MSIAEVMHIPLSITFSAGDLLHPVHNPALSLARHTTIMSPRGKEVSVSFSVLNPLFRNVVYHFTHFVSLLFVSDMTRGEAPRR